MKRSHRPAKTLALAACLAGSFSGFAQGPSTPMERGFNDPPNVARPRVWWHWMNGNITEQGIKLDLDWMHRVGVGGVTVFEGSIDTPQVVKDRLVYMTPPWKDAFRYAAVTAHSLGMQMTIASSPGWSATGGPWVPPSQGMKKLVWSETRIDGGQEFKGVLPPPPSVSGTFQDFAAPREKSEKPLPSFYADAAVVAYRLPADDKTQAQLDPYVSSSSGKVDAAKLSDGDVNDAALMFASGSSEKPDWIQLKYPHEQTIQAITIATLHDTLSPWDFDDEQPSHPYLEASRDGHTWERIAEIPTSSVPQRTVSFPAVTAQYFRLTFPAAASSGKQPGLAVTELVLSSASRVNQFEKRAGFATTQDYDKLATPAVTPGSVVPSSDVVDLTSRMQADGSIDWNAPAGRWAILRMGYSLTGHENGPAPAEATGLEVDKLNKTYVKNYVDGYLKTYADTVGPQLMGTAGVGSMLSDSIETGSQNWTDEMLAEFKQRRGYDARPWLPALTGVIIQSPDATDKFLWDFRRTIAELFAQNHYGEIGTVLHSKHMDYYAEALEYHRPTLGDDMEMRRYADTPMGAMWTYSDAPKPSYVADLRGAASVSHVYGQNIVGAESMTSPGPAWAWSPATLKPIADLEFALGVNQFFIHESAHQPLVGKAPGLTLGPYGLWFNRNDTWAEQAGPWVTYLARTSYMLQQGHFLADVAYFYGQEAPLTGLFGEKTMQDAPEGYAFDFVNSDVILNQLSFKDGLLATPGGATYRLLYLGGSSRHMTVPVLRRIRDLVEAGAVVDGEKPVDSPTLADDAAEFKSLTEQIWGSGAGGARSVHPLGKGKVYAGYSANEVFEDLKVEQDFTYAHPHADTKLMFVHRKAAGRDVYFVDNRSDKAETLDATFRVAGKAPDFWHADTGRIEPASYRIAGGHTTVPLTLAPHETVFVVFSKPASRTSRSIPVPSSTPLATLDGAWDATFQPDRGVTGPVHFDKLTSWSENSNAGVKYFSGTATYTQTFDAQPGWLKAGRHLYLDLGDVESLAAIRLNGKPLGVVWHPPFRVDIGAALKPGRNTLEVKVTNLWVNRLIGDQQPDAKEKYTFTTFKPYKADAPLLPSGLLGPVEILASSAGREKP